MDSLADSFSSKLVVSPCVFPTTGFTIIPPSETIDEENWPFYKPESFYPVKIGEVLCSRYQVLCKLGFGTTCTVWICRDFKHGTFVCLKALVNDYESVPREIKAYEPLSEHAKINPSNAQFVRQKLDQFQLRHGEYTYDFLVHEPLGLSMKAFMDVVCHYPMITIRYHAGCLLRGLEFIHRAGVIHADISARNIHFRTPSENFFKQLEEEEIRNPTPRKFQGERTIYKTSQITLGEISVDDLFGAHSAPVICDFGEARLANSEGLHCAEGEIVQPPPYRSPEIILGITWGPAVDVWNLGCLLWYCMTGKNLFPYTGPWDGRRCGECAEDADGIQLATMAALLGPPPPKLLINAGQRALDFFDEDGTPLYEVPDQTLEDRFASAFVGTTFEHPPEESAAFIAFIRRVLVWDGEERPRASDLFEDPWVRCNDL